jgi:hypothetical protein
MRRGIYALITVSRRGQQDGPTGQRPTRRTLSSPDQEEEPPAGESLPEPSARPL